MAYSLVKIGRTVGQTAETVIEFRYYTLVRYGTLKSFDTNFTLYKDLFIIIHTENVGENQIRVYFNPPKNISIRDTYKSFKTHVFNAQCFPFVN